MIAAFVEGVTQSLLPCSWILVVPAVTVGLATRRPFVLATFAGAVVVTAWAAAAGWIVSPLWPAGVAFIAGGVLWWRFGATYGPVALAGMGAARAWQPCVGAELGKALTTAQYDPSAVIAGLAMFLLGVVGLGLAVGLALGVLLERFGIGPVVKTGAAVAVALGLTIVTGLYPTIASALAEWSTSLWA
jgi:hypothetical protein